MKMSRLTIGLAACLAFAGVARAQGIEDPSRVPYYETFKGKKVAFVPVAMGFDLTEGWAALMRGQANRLGYTFEVRDPNFSTDAGAQAISQLITEKPDVIVVHNPDVQSYARLLKKAQEAGIYIVQINMKSAYPTEYFVGADYVDLGVKAADMIVQKCGAGSNKSGKVAIIQGVLTAAASAYQMAGISSVFSKHPEIKIVSNQAADWDSSKARAITQTVIQQNPDLCGAIGFWDIMDVGTGAAIREAGKQDQVFLVTSGGGEQQACDNIRNGVFGAEMSYDVPGQAHDMNAAIQTLLENKPKPGTMKTIIYTQLNILTKDNVGPGACWTAKTITN